MHEKPITRHLNKFMIYCQTDLQRCAGIGPNDCVKGWGWIQTVQGRTGWDGTEILSS